MRCWRSCFRRLVAIGAAVLSDLLDKTIRDPEQVSRTLRTEVIGSLPLMKNRHAAGSPNFKAGFKNGRAIEGEQDLTGFHESMRTLRNSILLGSFDRQYRSLLVTSAAPGEGKTTTAANLAAAHAEQGKRTLLIDGDLRRPSVHRNFNLPSVVGLSNVLLGEIPWRDALVKVEGLEDLHILPAGPPSRRASDLIGRGLAELLEEASSEYDLVLLDAPPLLGFAEPLQMATAVDGVIVVARAGQTSRKAVASVLATLNRLRAKVVGLVLNEVHKELSDSYYYYGYYRSYYAAKEEVAVMSVFVGIHDGHNASVAVVRDGRIELALQEERITRIKNQGDAPAGAAKLAFEVLHGRWSAGAGGAERPLHELQPVAARDDSRRDYERSSDLVSRCEAAVQGNLRRSRVSEAQGGSASGGVVRDRDCQRAHRDGGTSPGARFGGLPHGSLARRESSGAHLRRLGRPAVGDGEHRRAGRAVANRDGIRARLDRTAVRAGDAPSGHGCLWSTNTR